jgi:endonuclease/exonuclease/phosphatase (EEP) superfamily protein YafD
MKWLAVAPVIALLCGCVTLSTDPRAVVFAPGADPRVTTLKCDDVARALQGAADSDEAKSLGRRPFRLLTWNIHKEGDAGWQQDLSALAGENDLVLLQETVLQPSLRGILGDAGFSWVMASSFVYEADDVGVLTATRVAPVASCTQSAMEPWIRIPKSTVISWLPIVRAQATADVAGARETLAVVNIHAINFELFPDTYRAQLRALADALDGHRGPIILAGDLNTWNDERDRIVAEIAARLGLTELTLQPDRRAVFLGHHLDHIFVRGLRPIDVTALPVTSSDHNPVAATLVIP